jgi:hypothetical protein
MIFHVIMKIPEEVLSSKVTLASALEKKFTRAELPDRKLCVSCDRYVNSESIYFIDYLTIIRNHEMLSKDNKFKVPSIIKKINGDNFREDLYFKFKLYPDWLKTLVKICDECFMTTTKL